MAAACSQPIIAQSPVPTPRTDPSPNPPSGPQYSDQEVSSRFNKILEDSLGDDVCMTFAANRGLEAMIAQGTKELVQSKRTDQLPIAEKNLSYFLEQLKKKSGGAIKSKDIRDLLSSGDASFGVCPLFPFC
jgi:hypothetical protein